MRYLAIHGRINPLEALTHIGVYRLAAVVYQLRKDGLQILTEDLCVANKYGEDCHVASYRWDAHDESERGKAEKKAEAGDFYAARGYRPEEKRLPVSG